jgi:hypothetical protein
MRTGAGNLGPLKKKELNLAENNYSEVAETDEKD